MEEYVYPSGSMKSPIILVHGYCGSTMDENIFLQGYWHYAFSSVTRQFDTEGKEALTQVYEADVSPAGSAYDRACELWQQIVGIEKIKEIAR